jgi:hypothetical protein
MPADRRITVRLKKDARTTHIQSLSRASENRGAVIRHFKLEFTADREADRTPRFWSTYHHTFQGIVIYGGLKSTAILIHRASSPTGGTVITNGRFEAYLNRLGASYRLARLCLSRP